MATQVVFHPFDFFWRQWPIILFALLVPMRPSSDLSLRRGWVLLPAWFGVCVILATLFMWRTV